MGSGPRARGVGLGVLVLVGLLTGGAPEAGAGSVEGEDDWREVYIPHPEFRAYPDRDQLVVEGVVLLRVRRADHSEAIVAREEGGWEHVVLDGVHLSFYNLARQPLRPGPGRHVIVQDWSGGAHCCFDYHVLHVRGIQVRQEGLIRAGDCQLRVADLDQDGVLELIACDARFAYAFDLAFAESPVLPMVYTYRERGYVADNRRFPGVFRFRVAQERRRYREALQDGDQRGARRAAISILLHLLYAGQVTEAWCGFERLYRWADRPAIRREVVEILRRQPDPEDPRVPLADVSYALAPPGRCR